MYAEIYHNGFIQSVGFAENLFQLESNLEYTRIFSKCKKSLKTLAIVKLKSWKTKS